MKEKNKEIISILASAYPDAKPELVFSTPYELLVAVILSAQCTDKRVNLVTRELFKEYNTPEKMIGLSKEELAVKVKSCGLNNSKAQHILEASKDIVEKYNGEVPDKWEELIKLAGVGRKTANVVFSVAFHGDAIAVDTHVFRVSNRIGLATGKTPIEVEKGLMKNIDKNLWSKTHHYLIFHGRRVCHSQSPECGICGLKEYCKYYKGNKK